MAAATCRRCLHDTRRFKDHDDDDDDDDDDVCPRGRSPSSCDVAHLLLVCRKYELMSRDSQAEPQSQKGHSDKWLKMICLLLFLLAVTFLMAAVGKEEENDAQDYDADIFLPSKALWLLGSLLFWTVWLLLRLLQMFLWSIKGLLWFVSVSMSPLCRCVSFLLSHVLLLLPYLCDAVYFATACPLYVCGMCIIVVLALFNFTSVKSNIQRFCM
ncbi:uncharacterized protein LOC118320066 [Scophthalmus maximus]|uniref:uncharacterized protein LOC118320066 n=1 Tax=Scophthalmus maximus TaxID=52904 RepID=UPI001FA90DC7|nr:uncharacterized protein LOC118320066 [Scophthalmus maximus]